MQVGLSLNITSEPGRSDASVFEQHVLMALAAEELGFDSVFAMEHHFSGFSLSPSPLTLLAFLAGRTRRVLLGTGVVVLPWHHPIAIAEQIVLVDLLSGGRGLFGFGCGRSRGEFAGFGVRREDARARFIEAVTVITRAVSGEPVSFSGLFYDIPSVSLRPAAPRGIGGRLYGAASNPEFARTCRELGLELMLSTQRAWDELGAISRAEKIGAGEPIVFALIQVAPTCAEAAELASAYLREDIALARRHFDPDAADEPVLADAVQQYAAKQIIGSPGICVEQIRELVRATGTGHLVFEVAFGGMPPGLVQENLGLLAREVLPVIKTFECADDN